MLLKQIESDQLTYLKKSPSGDVLSGEVVLGGKPISVIIKRPYKRYWYRYINEIGRGSRAWRAWNKSWNLIVRDLPTAWPLLVMQKRSLGYITDAAIVFEKVPGDLLAAADLDAMTANPSRHALAPDQHNAQIEWYGFSHFDAKATNWIVKQDEQLGPRPIMIDVDGIRHRQWQALASAGCCEHEGSSAIHAGRFAGGIARDMHRFSRFDSGESPDEHDTLID